MALLELEHLTFAYPTESERPCLSDINLSLDAGEYLVLCGSSGSGKTTLLRQFKTVLTPHGKKSGSIRFKGIPLDKVPAREQAGLIGYVMQDPDSQIVTDKVWHELAFGLESLGCDQKVMRLRVAEMASYFGIQDWFHQSTAELSGGQKQLLNLASVMAMQPEVLILDEPTSQLDPIAAADFLNTISQLNRDLGTTILLSEHRLENVLPVCDRAVVLDGGKLIADGPPRAVINQLHDTSHPLFSAMPTPARAYYAAGKAGDACPLTVREGRNWMTKLAERKSIEYPSLIDEASSTEIDHPFLELHEVWFRYEKNAPDILRNVDLRVPQNQSFALLGGNGVGKSTLLRTICGICRPYRGKILLNGKLISARKGNLDSARVALLPQDPKLLFVKKTVREELAEMLTGLNAEQQQAQVEAAAAQWGLDQLLERHPYDLSGGEQQKTALAKVLLTQPKLLLLDEPTKGLDCFCKEELAQLLERFKTDGGTILMVSHDIEFCARHADRIGLFFDGSLTTINTSRRFFSDNSFYTTTANRMSRHLFSGAITAEDIAELCRRNKL